MPASRLIIGLGNPGSEYRDTRHNVGFLVVDELARRLQAGPNRNECNTLIRESRGVLLGCPLTYMNRSGYAAACLQQRFELEPDRILVVLDDVNLPLGRLRLRRGGSPGGHRGLESIVEALETDQVPRLRLGIGSAEEAVKGEELVDFVLTPFDPEEREAVEEMVQSAVDASVSWLDEGVDAAMNRFNG